MLCCRYSSAAVEAARVHLQPEHRLQRSSSSSSSSSAFSLSFSAAGAGVCLIIDQQQLTSLHSAGVSSRWRLVSSATFSLMTRAISGAYSGAYLGSPVACRPLLELDVLFWYWMRKIMLIYTVSQKKLCKRIFCQNFAKFWPIVKIFGINIAERTSFSEVYSFSTSPNLCQRTTVWNADVQNCYITL